MTVDHADRLSPKGHVYVELVREQWRAPLERGTARRALLTSALGLALMIFGAVGVFLAYGEPATFRAVLHARRKLMLPNASLRAEARRWSGSKPGAIEESMVWPVSMAGGPIAGGEDWRQTVTFRDTGHHSRVVVQRDRGSALDADAGTDPAGRGAMVPYAADVRLSS